MKWFFFNHVFLLAIACDASLQGRAKRSDVSLRLSDLEQNRNKRLDDKDQEDQPHTNLVRTDTNHVTSLNGEINKLIKSTHGSLFGMEGALRETLVANRKRKSARKANFRKRKQKWENEGEGRHGNMAMHHGDWHGYKRKICRTVSNVSRDSVAEDVYGNEVRIAPLVKLDGKKTTFYIHELYCEREHGRCLGINKARYSSHCETQYGYTVVPILQDDKIGYTKIKIRVGCNCILHRQVRDTRINILDLLD